MSLSIQEFFNKLTKESLHLVDEFYDPCIHFIDPVGEINNREDLKRYYANMYKSVESIRFDFLDEVMQGKTHALCWKMTMSVKGFNSGKPIVVDGMSHIRFGGREGKVIYHRDYFDLGAMLYEKVPVLGGIVRMLKKKLSSHE